MTNPNARKQVQDMIRRRTKKMAEQRTNSSRTSSPKQVVFVFFKAFDETKRNAKDSFDFEDELRSQSTLLNTRLSAFDPAVQVELMWYRIEEAESWKDLRLNGVKIVWSEGYLKENPSEDPELHLDMSHYLFESLED